jgi:hypothetical protein
VSSSATISAGPRPLMITSPPQPPSAFHSGSAARAIVVALLDNLEDAELSLHDEALILLGLERAALTGELEIGNVKEGQVGGTLQVMGYEGGELISTKNP